MSSIAIGLALDQGQAHGARPSDQRSFSGIAPGMAIPLPAGAGSVRVRVQSLDVYKGQYRVQTDALSAGPVAMMAPRILQDAASGTLAVGLPGLWAHDETATAPVRTYRWQRGGADIPGATGPQYTPVTADAGQTLQAIETASDAAGSRSQSTDTISIADLPDPFAVTLAADGTLQIVGNDGRSFILDDIMDIHDGTYSVPISTLAAGPVALTAPRLTAPTVAAAGAYLAVRPGLFAYDPALGPVSLAYNSTGANAVDASDPAAPRLLIDTADAGRTITVTATVRQGTASLARSTNMILVAELPDLFAVTLAADGTLRIEGNDGRSFLLDDQTDIHDGTYSVPPTALAAGPVALTAPTLTALTLAEAGASLGVTPGLFAYDPALGPVTLSYTSTGANAVDASDPAAPRLLIDTADAGRTITVTATVRQGAASLVRSTNSIAIAALPDPFAVRLATDGTLRIEGNDGRDFILDDSMNRYDGTYSIAAGSLGSGPVTLVPPVVTGAAQVGQILSIAPALFAYEPDLGTVTVSYSTTGANAVDIADPDNPRLLVDAADAGRTITVTATASQGTHATGSVSNAMNIPAVSGVTARTVAQFQDSTLIATPSFPLDLSGARIGDRLVLVYGTNSSIAPVSVTLGGAPLGAPIADTGSGSTGGRIWVYEHVLTQPGATATAVTVTLSASNNRHMLSAVVVAGGIRESVGADFQLNIGTASVSVTPATARNAIVAVSMGRASFFGGHSWTNATQDGAVFRNIPADRAAAIAFAADVPVAAYTVSFDPDPTGSTSDEVGLAVLVYSAL